MIEKSEIKVAEDSLTNDLAKSQDSYQFAFWHPYILGIQEMSGED